MSYLTEDHRPGCCPRRREKAKDPRAGEKTLVRWSRTNWGRAEEIVGDTWVGISAIGHFHRTRGEGGRDGWPRTGGQVKQTEEGRKGGCPDGRRKGSRGRSRGQSLGIGWRLFSASTSISICFQRCNELVFLFVLARSLTRARARVWESFCDGENRYRE